MALPASVVAAGWIPFVVTVLVTLATSFLYIKYFSSKYESTVITSVTASLALSVALFTTCLVPVDVFLVSFMKNSNGTFKDWALDPMVRDSLENTILYAYYALYGCMGLFMFFILPFVYFYYEEQDSIATTGSKICGALKYTLVFLLVAAILIIVGSFIPLKEAPHTNSTDWEKIEFLIGELGNNKGEDVLSFVLSILTVVGMIVFLIFGGYGMSAWPCGLIKGTRSIRYDREEIQDQRVVLQNRIALLKDKYPDRQPMSSQDQSRLYDLEEQLRLLERRERHLNEAARSWFTKCAIVLAPFQALLGVAMTIFGMLIFVSLLLTNIDKAMHSLGPKMGYALPTRTLPNPIDIILVYAQMVFPLDYVLFAAVALFLLFCAMNALQKMGIWFLWVRVYRIRPNRTRPQGLLLLGMTLMFVVLAINIFIYLITPQYVMYGSQNYWGNVTDDTTDQNFLKLVPCSTNAPPDDCIMSRTSLLLTRFCYKAWIFGATYYYCSWAFLAITVVGSVISLFKRRASVIEGAVDRDDFDESDDEPLIT